MVQLLTIHRGAIFLQTLPKFLLFCRYFSSKRQIFSKSARALEPLEMNPFSGQFLWLQFLDDYLYFLDCKIFQAIVLRMAWFCLIFVWVHPVALMMFESASGMSCFSYTKPWSPVLWNNSASGRDSFPIHNIPLCSNETEVIRIFALLHSWERISKFLYFGPERIILCFCPKTPQGLCYHIIIHMYKRGTSFVIL